MANDGVIARRYARGLAEFARDESRLDEVRRDLRRLADVVDSGASPDGRSELLAFLRSPIATPADKAAACERILRELGIGDDVANFLQVLLRHNRVELLPRIVRSFAEIAGRVTGEYTAVVHTARPLSDDQSERLEKALSTAFGARVAVHQQVEPGLLAGARIAVGDKTFDGTVLGRLRELRQRLIASGQADLKMMEEEKAAGE